jgi:hypothetical protein
MSIPPLLPYIIGFRARERENNRMHTSTNKLGLYRNRSVLRIFYPTELALERERGNGSKYRNSNKLGFHRKGSFFESNLIDNREGGRERG